MNLLAMFKRLSILPGSQNHQKYEFLTVLVTNISGNHFIVSFVFFNLFPKSKNYQKAIKTQKTTHKRKKHKNTKTHNKKKISEDYLFC